MDSVGLLVDRNNLLTLNPVEWVAEPELQPPETSKTSRGVGKGSQCVPLLFTSFPFCRGEHGLLSLRCTATLVIFPIVPSCWPFLCTFLPPLPFLDLPSDNPSILAVDSLVFCNLPGYQFLVTGSRNGKIVENAN